MTFPRTTDIVLSSFAATRKLSAGTATFPIVTLGRSPLADLTNTCRHIARLVAAEPSPSLRLVLVGAPPAPVESWALHYAAHTLGISSVAWSPDFSTEPSPVSSAAAPAVSKQSRTLDVRAIYGKAAELTFAADRTITIRFDGRSESATLQASARLVVADHHQAQRLLEGMRIKMKIPPGTRLEVSRSGVFTSITEMEALTLELASIGAGFRANFLPPPPASGGLRAADALFWAFIFGIPLARIAVPGPVVAAAAALFAAVVCGNHLLRRRRQSLKEKQSVRDSIISDEAAFTQHAIWTT